MKSSRALSGIGCITTLLGSQALALDPNAPFGVTAFIPGTTRWDAIRDAGISWARCDFSWRMVETSNNVFNWTTTDDEVAQANARGIHIYAGLGYTPTWASSNPQHRPQDPPANSADWYDYVFTVVTRYKGSIKHWELWNEPNLSQFWAGTRQQYIDNILKVGADAAHAADPTCFVGAPEISRCCSGDTWMTDVLNQAGNKIDIITHHQYDFVLPSDRLNAIDQMHTLVTNAGYGNKPTWVTESGWRSDEPGVNETIQGQYLVAMLQGMETRPWLRQFNWYQIWEGPTELFGLLRQNETPKPVWFAYRDFYRASNWGPQTPFGGTARPVPGLIQAEDFDDGGEGVAYHDTDAGNNGGQYRSTGVDIEGCADTGGGFDIGFTGAGEFLKYTINVAATGTYSVQLRIASDSAAGTYHIQIGGLNKTGVLSLPVTGGWQTWQTVTIPNIQMNAGIQTLKLYIDGGGFNLNWINVPGTAPMPSLNVKTATSGITIDGNPNDWNLSEFVTKIRGGESGSGDIALVGFDGGSTVYRGAFVGVLPTSAADHTAKVYSRHDSAYQYFLVRVDDSNLQAPYGVGTNWANDCVEFFIDPSNDGGAAAMNNSASDIQLDIDVLNQKNVYMCTAGYTTQVLNGVTSAVTTDATGWWLEVRILKSALDPDLPASGTFGVDFTFRDNDNNNDPALTTVYTWAESSTAGFPSKIPDHWGDASFAALPSQSPFGGTPRTIPGTIQAEDFDNGGEGIAYHDDDTVNSGGQYRSTGVDIETTSDTGGGYNVGWIGNNEWWEYTVNVTNTGDHTFKLRVASGGTNPAFSLKMNGNAITGAKTFASTGGFQNWTTILVPAVFLNAGNNQVLQVFSNTGSWNINKVDVTYGGADAVSEDLGTTNTDDGMTHPQPGDGDTVATTIGGHNCRVNVNNANDFYFYFAVFDSYAFQGSRPNVWISFDYYDTGTGSLTLQYDATSSNYKNGPSVTFTNSNTWKSVAWNVTDAYFGNRQNNGADFRIAAPVGKTFYIDTVQVSLAQP